jgi:arsenical pump membrane protein
VTGLLLIGVVANADGLFAAAASWLGRLTHRELPLYFAAMLLVALVTVFLNLDTSVAFLTPVLVLVGRQRGAGEQRLLYGCVFMSNAASLLLPGSNLTNLLILQEEHISGTVFLARMLAPWIASVLTTVLVVGFALRHKNNPVAKSTARFSVGAVRPLSAAGICLAVLLILTLPNAALPVLLVGIVLTLARLIRGRIELRPIRESVDIVSLTGIFLLAVSLGTLARTWSFPAELMRHTDSVATAAIGAIASVLVNNLPAAVLLGSRMPAHPRSLLLGLNIGPNLAVTGSLSALIWWQAARSVGAKPSAGRYSAVGIILVPLTLAAALGAGQVFGAR